MPDKNAKVDCVYNIVEHGIGNRTEVRSEYDTVERTGEEHKDASFRDEDKVRDLNIITRKLDTNCNKGRNSDSPERSNTKSTNTDKGEAALALVHSTIKRTETYIEPTKRRSVRSNRQVQESLHKEAREM